MSLSPHVKVFRKIKIDADGNCLFRAVSAFLYGNEDAHLRLRMNTVDAICQSWDDIKYHVLHDSDEEIDCQEYCNKMRQAGSYGTSVECLMMSRLYKITFKIFLDPNPGKRITRSYHTNSDPIIICQENFPHLCYLLLSGNSVAGHFDMLVPDKKDSDKFSLLSQPSMQQNLIKDCKMSPVDSCQNSIINTSASLNPCPYCGKKFKSVKIHISKAHPGEHRQVITQRYIKNQSTNIDDFVQENNSSSVEFQKYLSDLTNWKKKFAVEMSDKEFDNEIKFFQSFLVSSMHYLPGPKHPANKYYEARRKRKDILVRNNNKYKDTTNPERKTKRDKQKRKETFLYESIQYNFYNRRRVAVRKVMNSKDDNICTIPLDTLSSDFGDRFGTENNKVYTRMHNKTVVESQEDFEVILEDIQQSIKYIKIDTAPGPDKIILRSLKTKIVAEILVLLTNRIINTGYVPTSLKIARTILIYKGGDLSVTSNWRPISICSLIRRVIERVLIKQISRFIVFNSNQQGFTSTPGTFINTSLLYGILTAAKTEKKSMTAMFLDISKAYDNVGLKHIENTVNATQIPTKLKRLIIELQKGNSIQIETSLGKTKPIELKRGLLQGAPLSPILYNLCTDHILADISEPGIAEFYGFSINNSTPRISIMGFADDTVLIANDEHSAFFLLEMAQQRFSDIGLSLNDSKTQIIHIRHGKLIEKEFFINNTKVNSIGNSATIKYLGVSFNNSVIFDEFSIIKKLDENIKLVVSSPFLHQDQKLTVLNQYIWPTLVYPYQTTPSHKMPKSFLNNLDKMIKSAVKEILCLPSDTPDHLLYSPRTHKGLGLVRASWEAFLQRFGICTILEKSGNQTIPFVMNLPKEKQLCLDALNISTSEDLLLDTEDSSLNSRKIRKFLRLREFSEWCKLPHKGRGVELFAEYTPANSWMSTRKGMTISEYTDAIKMIGNVTSCRTTPGRSNNGNQCRRCSVGTENISFETLPHILGSCPFGEALRNNRHNAIRLSLAKILRDRGWETYEEVPGLADDGSWRRVDIIAIDRKRRKGYILDPTVRFEDNINQPGAVHTEKCKIYNPTISYFKTKYDIDSIEVFGYFIGARGTIPTFFIENFCKLFNVPTRYAKDIAISALKGSIMILRHHLFSA